MIRTDGGLDESVRFPINDVAAAAGPRLRIALLAEELDAVFRRDGADAAFPGKLAAGWQAAAKGADAGDDFLPQGFIQSQVGGFVCFRLVL